MKGKKLLWIPLLFIASITMVNVAKAQVHSSLYVDPENSTAFVDDTFIVNVNVFNMTNLYGFEFKLFYDTSVLDGVSVELPLGHFLTPVDPTKIFVAALEIDDVYNATHGRVLASALLLRPEQTRNGSGTLVSIAFNATALGSTTLDLRDTKLGDPDGLPLAHEAVDGYFTGLSSPAASFTISPDPPYYATQPLTFNATASYDADGTIDSYQWDFGDGNVTTVTDPTITHAYMSIGDYTVTLTVTDNDNLTDTATADVTVLLHDIVVTSVNAVPPKVTVGESVSVDVKVANEGDFSETFNVTVYYNGNVLDTQTDITLSAGANVTLTFSWNTTNVSAGNYTIKADASVVPNETETTNNMHTNGTVEVKEVEEAPTTPLVIYVAAAILIVIIIAAIVVYFVRFRKS